MSFVKFYYLLKRAFAGIYESFVLNIIAILTITISFIILSSFILTFINIDSILKNVSFDVEVIGFIKNDSPDNKLLPLLSSLEEREYIASVRHIKREEAADRFIEENAELSDLLRGLEQNPLPATLEITLKKNINRDDILRLIEELRVSDLFTEVHSEREWLEHYMNILKTAKIWGSLTILLLIIAIAFIISNTVRLVFFARRDEIEIMLLVGATKNYVKFPFLIEGFIQGFTGSILSTFLLWVFFIATSNSINSIWILKILKREIFFFNTPQIFYIVLFGCAVGVLASFFSLGKYLTYWKE